MDIRSDLCESSITKTQWSVIWVSVTDEPFGIIPIISAVSDHKYETLSVTPNINWIDST